MRSGGRGLMSSRVPRAGAAARDDRGRRCGTDVPPAAGSAAYPRTSTLQEWLPVEALPELVAGLDTPLPPGADGAEQARSHRRVGE